jgi:hypothetical protein
MEQTKLRAQVKSTVLKFNFIMMSDLSFAIDFNLGHSFNHSSYRLRKQHKRDEECEAVIIIQLI